MHDTFDTVITNVRIASMADNGQPYGTTSHTAVGIRSGKIAALFEELPADISATHTVDGNGQWLLPGLIDCHTHLIYAGDRANEFEMRLQGISYAEIAKQGGGIKSTVKATRQASEKALFDSAKQRAERLLEEGVTTLEIKSGYGLDLDTERRMLKVARQLEDALPVSVRTTFLGAHALPAEYSNDADGYISLVCDTMLPDIAANKLADAVDVFCESIGFTPAQTERVFQAAKAHGLPVKAHVEQLSDLKGAVLAANYDALSVDHIEYLAEEDVGHLKDTVAVLLPGAFYYLHETQKPPIEALRKQGIPMAVATDLNPGSSPLASLLTAMNMACVLFAITPEEALLGTTRHAAKALGLNDRGMIDEGLRADLTLWDIDHPAQLVYSINGQRPKARWVGGRHV
ncbi:imidazolonepropionase [Aestuariibacter halophilus]|uniref:Imidazolonepropionase n=1 Tax=Fluctibacter halophilus TaxID=226011 RepID=A0ABS8GCH0_9ALTE|nr:imidazolonepropionase [Aestuariibacter halophilus]MCC2617484.1 imidazolonepropionase [Aestuariibacter halophilus]